MIRYLIGLLLVFVSAQLWAQSEAIYGTQYLNPQVHNPAFAGSEKGKLLLNAHLRMQWLGVEGAPRQQYLSAHMTLEPIHSGVGLSLENDMLGVHRMTTVALDYAYQLRLAHSYISIGLRPMISQVYIDGRKIITPDGNYENIINHNDNILPISASDALLWDMCLGMAYVSDNLELGIACMDALENSSDIKGIAGSISYQNNRSFLFQGKYVQKLSDHLELEPTAFFYTNLTIHQSELGINCLYKHNIYIGGALKGYNSMTIDAVQARIGLKFGGKYQLGYHYEIGMSGLKQYSSGSHELYLSYSLDNLFRTKPPKIIYNPRRV